MKVFKQICPRAAPINAAGLRLDRALSPRWQLSAKIAVYRNLSNKGIIQRRGARRRRPVPRSNFVAERKRKVNSR